MIWYYVILFVTSLLTAAFSWLPKITTLPAIGGYDIDAALVSGMSMFYTVAHSLWYLWDIWVAFLVLMSYYTAKMVLKMFLGHRAPGAH